MNKGRQQVRTKKLKNREPGSLLRNDFADGLKSAEIGIAANRSADAGGKVVELPLKS